MRNSPLGYAVVAGAVLAALAFRLAALDLRPMHHDEANQAFKCGELLEKGTYVYDPADHHGPSLYYLTLPGARLAAGRSFVNTTESTYRMVPALFGVLLVALILLLRDELGPRAAAVSMLLAAVSPAMVYYSRFYIQEMLLACFTVGMIVSGWRYFRRKNAGWAVLTGLFAGMMFVTKETSVVAYIAVVLGLAMCLLWNRLVKAGPTAGQTGRFSAWHLAAGLAVAAVVWAAFYSSFFTHSEGLKDSVRTFGIYLGRADETLHRRGWFYYFSILGWRRESGAPVWPNTPTR